MTPEQELVRFREQEKVRPRRAKSTKIVFVVLAAAAIIAFAYAFYIQTIGNRDAREYDVEMKKMHAALKLAEERAAGLEEIAMHETKVADSLTAVCGQKP